MPKPDLRSIELETDSDEWFGSFDEDDRESVKILDTLMREQAKCKKKSKSNAAQS